MVYGAEGNRDGVRSLRAALQTYEPEHANLDEPVLLDPDNVECKQIWRRHNETCAQHLPLAPFARTTTP